MNPNETRQTDMEDPDEAGLDVQVCPSCSMEKAEWGDPAKGYKKDDETYCCIGCAEGTGCTCSEDQKNAKPESATIRSGNRK